MSSYGRVEAVYDRVAGTQVATTVTGNGVIATLTVDSTYDFTESGGSFLHLESGVTYVYTSFDELSSVVTLAAPIANGTVLADADTLIVLPQGSTRWANVRMDDVVEEDSVEMRVSQPVRVLLPLGPRDGLADGEVVAYEQIDRDEWLITDVVGDDPALQPETLGTIQIPQTNVLPDGVVPGTVTGATASGGKSFIYLKWNPVTLNAVGGAQVDLVHYNVYASTSASMAHDSTTKIAETYGTQAMARELASGVAFKFDVVYYFDIVPVDADGVGTTGIANGTMNRLGTDDLLVGSVTAGLLETVMILGTTITTRSDDASGELAGPGITLAPDSLVAYDANGDATLEIRPDSTPSAVFRGDAEIDHLTVQTLTTLQQTLLTQGSVLTMQKGVVPPSNAPTITVSWETMLTDILWSTNDYHGFSLNQAKTSFFTYFGGDSFIEQHSMTDGSLEAVSDDSLTGTLRDVCYIPSGLGSNANTGGWIWMVKVIGSQWYLQRWNATALTAGSDVAITLSPAPTGWATVGIDYTTGQIMVGYIDSVTFQLTIKRYTCTNSGGTALTLDSTWTSGSSTTFSDIVHPQVLMYGNFDFGAPYVVFKNIGTSSTTTYPQFMVINPTTKLHDTAKEWDYGAVPLKLAGMTWDGSNFKALFHDGLVHKYEAGNTWTAAADNKWWAAYAWTDGTIGTPLAASSSNSAKILFAATGTAAAAGTGAARGSAALALSASGTAAAAGGGGTFSDSFTRSDAAVLGNGWLQPSTSVAFQIISNQAAPSTSTTVARWPTDPSNPTSVFSQITVAATIPASSFVGPALKIPTLGTTLSNTGEFYCFIATTTSLTIRSKGIATSALTNVGTAITFTVNAGDVMRLEYNGTDLIGYVNGVEKIRRAESLGPITTGGNGVGFYSTGNSLNRFDDWSGG